MAREVLVRGEGEAAAMPDYATVRVSIEVDANTQEQCYRDVAAIAKGVDAAYAAHASAIRRQRTTSVLINPRSRWKKGETVRSGWRGGRTSVLEITDFERLGAFLADVVEAGGAVGGLSWQLDTSNPAYDDARREAARQARSKAEIYADALGLVLGEVTWVAEPGMRLGHGAPGPVLTAGFATRAAAGPLAEEPIDINPDEIIVRASVEVSFELAS